MWVHALDNSDMTWFSPKWNCYPDQNTGSRGYDAYMLGFHHENVRNGAYCDEVYASKRTFICEGML